MAGKKISQLTEITTPSLTGITVVNDGGTSYKSTLNTLRSILVDSGSHYFTGSQTINGNLVISGSLTAQQYILSSSVTNLVIESISGSTAFGNSLDDNHLFTGSLKLTGSLIINGITYSPTASYSLEALTSSYTQQANSASNAITASYILQATSASYATTASYALISSVFPYSGSAIITGSLEVTGSVSNGLNSLATGNYSHAEGYYTTASGYASNAKGRQTNASGNYSSAEGWATTASSAYSHAEGISSTASGQNSHAEGESTSATAQASHAEGYASSANGIGAHAEGWATQANGIYSNTKGYNSVASGDFQMVIGKNNISSSVEGAFIIGNGSDTSNRSNLVFTSGSHFQISGSANISGSLILEGTLELTGALSVSASQFSIYGSGSGNPIFSVNGSIGQILAVYDELTGSLWSINDASGLPVFEANSDSRLFMGNYQAPILMTSVKTTLAAINDNIVYSNIPTANYNFVYYDYVINSGSNWRAGNLSAMWDGTSTYISESINFNLGVTTGVTYTVSAISGNLILSASATTAGWISKFMIRAI